MKPFQDFLSKLYKKYVSHNVGDLTKDYFGLVHDVVDLDRMEKRDRVEFLSKCHEVWENPTFQKIINSLTQKQKDSTMKSAETESHLLCGRMSIYGVNSVLEEYRKYNSLYEREQERKEETNPYDPI